MDYEKSDLYQKGKGENPTNEKEAKRINERISKTKKSHDSIRKKNEGKKEMSYLSGIPNTVLALVGIGLTLFIAKDKLGLEDKINDVRGRIGI